MKILSFLGNQIRIGHLLIIGVVLYLFYNKGPAQRVVCDHPGGTYKNYDAADTYNFNQPAPKNTTYVTDTTIYQAYYLGMDSLQLLDLINAFLVEFLAKHEYSDTVKSNDVTLAWNAAVQGNTLQNIGWTIQNTRIPEMPDKPRGKIQLGGFAAMMNNQFTAGPMATYINKREASLSIGYDPFHQGGFIGLQKTLSFKK